MRRLLSAFAVVAGLLAAGTMSCTFHVGGVALGFDSDASVQDLAGADLAGADLAPPPPVDLAGICNGGATSGCASDGTTLLVCENGQPVATVCTDGCSSDGTPHCKQFDPGGVAAPSDYLASGLVDVVIPANTTAVFNTDTGEINTPARQGGLGNNNGIGFRQVTQPGSTISVGIFSMKSLTLSDGAILNVVGSRPISIVTSGDIVLNGTIDVLGSCVVGSPVAGGAPGGAGQAAGGNAGGGTGGGKPGQFAGGGTGGGGGGGYGEHGGAGAASFFSSTAGGPGGVRFGDLSAVDPILGGGSGGGSGAAGVGVLGGAGGSGGGAVQLASNGGVTLGSPAIIQAGGCHGSPGSAGVPVAGGGGGSGGSVLIEGRTVQLNGGAIIAVNGGGGGGGGGGGPGEDGPDNQDAAAGGNSGSGGPGSRGGDGGHTTSLAGDPGDAPSGGEQGGGGGGGVGRIALKSKTGLVLMMGVNLSPEVGETLQGHPSPATVGMAQFH